MTRTKGPVPRGDHHEFHQLKPRIESLVESQRRYLNTALSDARRLFGENKLEEAGLPLFRAYRGLPKNKALIKFLSEPGVKALLLKTESYYLQDQQKEMPKADTELFFVIDEKNNSIELTDKGIEHITSRGEDPNFFVLPDVGAMIADIEKSNLEASDKAEQKTVLMQDFQVKSERIHTINQLLKAYCLFERDIEYIVDQNKVKIVDEQTGRVLDGRRYSDGLHQALEAKEGIKIRNENQTLASITFQNYFRLYEKLAGMTGTASTEALEFEEIYNLKVIEIPTNQAIARIDEEDEIYKTEKAKLDAVFKTIKTCYEKEQPVLVGTISIEKSEQISKLLKDNKLPHNVLNAKQHAREAQVVAEAGLAGAVTIATNMAGRGTDIKLGPGVKEAGGLAIIGTERHESRRVDRQLRGRAGRQGDPGSSQFYVSLEDDLMRMFGSERIAGMMDKLGYKEGDVIQHSMISNSIQRAQKKVEENNFGIRKRLLEYDDVMNAQRKLIYKLRKNALFGDRLDIDVDNMFFDLCEQTVQQNINAEFTDFEVELIRILGVSSPVNEEEFKLSDANTLVNLVYQSMLTQYQRKCGKFATKAYPQVKHVYETMSDRYKNIVFPLTDGRREVQLIVNLEEAYNSQCTNVSKQFEKHVILGIIDNEWKEHLREMDDLRSAVNNATYEQKDPLVIYKLESYDLFKNMINRVNISSVELLMNLDIPFEQEMQSTNKESNESHYAQARTNVSSSGQAPRFEGSQGYQEAIQNSMNEPVKKEPVVVDPKINRNDPCPCGSGKKYKQCHGK